MTNGASNVIKLIQLHAPDRPSGVIWVQFDHADVGRKPDMITDNCILKASSLLGHLSNLLPQCLQLVKIELFKL